MKKTYNKELADNLKFIVESGKMVYGTAPTAKSKVTFAFGSLEKAATTNKAGQIAFGVDTTTGSGAIYVGDELVSSKILDVSFLNTEGTNATEGFITITEGAEGSEVTKKLATDGKYYASNDTLAQGVSFVNTKKIKISWVGVNGAVEHATFNDVTDLAVVKALIKAQADANAKEIEELQKRVADTSARVADTSANVKDISTFLRQTDNITEDTELGAITVTATESAENVVGTKYKIGVNVDGTSVKVVNDKLAVDTYKFEKLATADAHDAATYSIKKISAENNTETELLKIDIPKDKVLKSVHSCWAIHKEGTGYVDLVVDARSDNKPTANSDGNYTKGDNTYSASEWSIDQYLHFTWHTVGDNDNDGVLTETFIKITDLAPIYVGDRDKVTSDASIGKYIMVGGDHVINWDASRFYADFVVANIIDVSLRAIDTHLSVIDGSIHILDGSVNGIEDSYLTEYTYTANGTLNDYVSNTGYISADTSLAIHELKIDMKQDGVDTSSRIDIPTAQGVRAVENKFDTLLAWVDLDHA